MRGDTAKIAEGCAGAADEVMLDGQNRFCDDSEIAFEKKVIDADDRAGQRIFDGSQEGVGGAFLDGAKGGVEGGTWHGDDLFAKKLESGFFAESAAFALEGDAHWFRVCRGHKCS